MDQYLSTTHNKLKSNDYEELTLVLGNESCDLDSAVSALVYSFFLHWQEQRERDRNTHLFVTLLNTDRQDLPLKTEVAKVFAEQGIPDDRIVFRDDLDLQQLVSNGKTKVILVDHHSLAANDRFLAPYVTEIIDHRPIDKSTWNYKENTTCIINPVGSCCTLIAQRIKELTPKEIDFFQENPTCADMLYSTIILDTVNFSNDLKKGTPLDEEMVLYLETILKPKDFASERIKKLEHLSRAKSDVSSLTAAQLLRKDVKIFGSVLVPSFPILVQVFLKRPNCTKALSEALALRGCTVALLLGMDYSEGMKRDTAVYSEDPAEVQKLSSLLEGWTTPPLQLDPLPAPSETLCRYYKQQNLTATRKQYIPVLNEFMKNKSSSS